jgi:D-amino-acid dehydrogenase
MKICILGSGVIGVTSAYMLASRGHEVTVVDGAAAPAAKCSHANGGQLSYSHAEPWANPGVFPKLWKWMFMEDAPLVFRPKLDRHWLRWGALFMLNCLPHRARAHAETHLRLGLYSRSQMAAIIADTGIDFSHQERGILHVFNHRGDFESAKKQMRFQETLGCEQTALTRDETLQKEPTLADAADTIVGSIHASMDATGNIHSFTTQLAEHCEASLNVRFCYNKEIRRLHVDHGHISHIETPEGYESGYDAYVMCLGAQSPLQLRKLGLYVPIYPMKGYSITLKANEFSPQASVTDEARKIVHTRLGDTVRVAGTAEFAGYDDSVNQRRINGIMRGIKAMFPKADLSEVSEWACLRPSTPDGPPIIGSTPYQNLYINTGHGTLGWTQAAGSARLLADVMEGTPTEIPLTGLDIERNLIKF